MEEELKTERDFINTTLHVLDALVVVLDRKGQVVRFNHACEGLTGYTEDEVTGKSLDFFLLGEEVEGVQAVFSDLLSGRSPRKYRNHWKTRNGSPKLIEWSNSVLVSPQGEVTHIIATGIDLTRFQNHTIPS
jgi:PAS domain S-box